MPSAWGVTHVSAANMRGVVRGSQMEEFKLAMWPTSSENTSEARRISRSFPLCLRYSLGPNNIIDLIHKDIFLLLLAHNRLAIKFCYFELILSNCNH